MLMKADRPNTNLSVTGFHLNEVPMRISLNADRAFYRRVLGVAVPIIVQNGITNFVSLLDNIMVGRVGTVPMSGVSIVNGLAFVFYLCIFGACSGAGIFTAQFHGSRDDRGIRHTVRFKLLIALVLSVLGITVFLLGGRQLIGLYLRGEGDPLTAAGAMDYGLRYLRITVWGFLPFALCSAYSGTLRETGETVVPMVGGITAVFVNLFFNYVLIFGHFGAPAMGVEGAALATVISRFVELFLVAGWTHLHPERNPFIRGVYRSPYIPGKLLASITVKGMPLLINEFLWSSGVAVLNQCYSTCGLDVVPAMNIAGTMSNLSNVVVLALGNTVGILMGQMLGASLPEKEIRSANRKLITISVVSGLLFGALEASLSAAFPLVYNTTQEVRHLATRLILVVAVLMPFMACTNATYFTLRSGGQTFVTFLFDSCFMWVVCVPLAYCLSRFAGLPILPLYILCQLTEILKCVIGAAMLKRGRWIQNLTQ